jgi:hypothetical protein
MAWLMPVVGLIPDGIAHASALHTALHCTLNSTVLNQVKIAARDLEHVIAGLSMRIANHPDEVDIPQIPFTNLANKIFKSHKYDL